MKKNISILIHVHTIINQLHSNKIIFFKGHLEEGDEMSLYQHDARGSIKTSRDIKLSVVQSLRRV